MVNTLQVVETRETANVGADEISAGVATNSKTDTNSLRTGGGDGSGNGDAKQGRKPRPLKIRANAILNQLVDIEESTDEKVALDRADRGAKMVAEIEKAVAVIRADAADKPRVSQKKAAAVIRELLALQSEIQDNLDTLEDGRLALTDDDLAILKG